RLQRRGHHQRRPLVPAQRHAADGAVAPRRGPPERRRRARRLARRGPAGPLRRAPGGRRRAPARAGRPSGGAGRTVSAALIRPGALAGTLRPTPVSTARLADLLMGCDGAAGFRALVRLALPEAE